VVFHHRSAFYIAKYSQDEPVTTCRGCLDDAEQEQVVIAQDKAEEEGKDA